jgi:hypothetical protein
MTWEFVLSPEPEVHTAPCSAEHLETEDGRRGETGLLKVGLEEGGDLSVWNLPLRGSGNAKGFYETQGSR